MTTEKFQRNISHKSTSQVTDSDGNIVIDVGNKDTWKFKAMQSKYLTTFTTAEKYLSFYPFLISISHNGQEKH